MTTKTPSAPSAREESGMEVPEEVREALDKAVEQGFWLGRGPFVHGAAAVARNVALSAISRALANARAEGRQEGIEEALQRALTNPVRPPPLNCGHNDPSRQRVIMTRECACGASTQIALKDPSLSALPSLDAIATGEALTLDQFAADFFGPKTEQP